MKTAIEALRKAPKDIPAPWEVRRFFPGKLIISFAGEQATLGEDFGSAAELRKAIEWLVHQFGGKVKWDE